MPVSRALLSLFVLATLTACPSRSERDAERSAAQRNATPGAPTSADGMPMPAATTTPAAAVTLDAYHWDLASAVAADGTPIAALRPETGHPLRLDFSEGRVAVSGGCNRIGGPYDVQGDQLRVTELVQTEMACADRRLMDLDAAIAARLGGVLKTELRTGDPPQLQLSATNGDVLRFSGVPTPQTRYGGAGTTLFLEIAPQRERCAHALIPNMQCLYVRERHYDAQGQLTGFGEWRSLFEEIEGFTHEPGLRTVARVRRFDVKNPPADGPAVAYVLDMVVESQRAAKPPSDEELTPQPQPQPQQ